jgi:hypothetical protein
MVKAAVLAADMSVKGTRSGSRRPRDEPALIEDAELALGHVDGHGLVGMGEPDLDPLTGDLDLAALGCPAADQDRSLGDDHGATDQPGAVQPGPGAARHRRGQRPDQRAVGGHVHGGRPHSPIRRSSPRPSGSL